MTISHLSEDERRIRVPWVERQSTDPDASQSEDESQ
ncbi:MAG: hypothetical protein JWN75_413 [Candidatus Saccharibacteria bacterium]|nr:hypothetical protein [Candidatus Saccharibacteria bacterium]